MVDVVKSFTLDAIMLNGQPTGVLKEKALSGKQSDYSTNEEALMIASLAVCASCSAKNTCQPQVVEAARHFGIFVNTDLWIAGKMVAHEVCRLAKEGVPETEYSKVMQSWDHSNY